MLISNITLINTILELFTVGQFTWLFLNTHYIQLSYENEVVYSVVFIVPQAGIVNEYN